jgi:hypothetical protein
MFWPLPEVDKSWCQGEDLMVHDEGVSRRSMLTGAAVGISAAAGATFAGAPAAGAADARHPALPASLAEVVRGWAQAPSSHPAMGDWRRVGYRRGSGKPRARNGHVVTAAGVGVQPGQSRDVSRALQAALDRLGAAGGGVLQLQPGRYVLDSPLFVHDSNVVLRGAGTGRTTLYFTRPLRQSVGIADGGDGVSSSWSWHGGQVFFVARERLARSTAENWDPRRREGWLAGPELATVAPATRGTDVLLIDDTSAITPGDMVLLEVDNPGNHRLLREIAGDIAGAETYDWALRAAKIAAPLLLEDFVSWRWPVVVTEVLSPRTVRIEQPLRLTIHRDTPARLLALGPTLHDSGVEDLTIENKLLIQTTHNINPGSNGVCFHAVHDCWASDVRVVNADVAFALTTAKSCTLSGISYGGRSLHHFVACRVLSHDNLVEDFTLEDFTVPAVPGSYLHGINLEGLSSGNVFRRGTMHTGTFDSHRMMPFENLRTAITLTNKDAVPGGAFDAGPWFGARTVHWGITVTNDRNLCVDISDAAPRGLTAGIVGLTQPGSGGLGSDATHAAFGGDLESERLAFGTDLARAQDLLELQRQAAPAR